MLVFSVVHSGAYSINTACNRPSAQRLQFRCYCYTHKRNIGTYMKTAKLQNPYMHAHKGRQPGEAQKREATRANKQKTVDALACSSHQWSMLKLSDMCLPFLFLPRYSNCSMDGSGKSSPKRRGWICAFLCSITIPPDRQNTPIFRIFFFFFGGIFFFYIVGCVKPCPPCCSLIGKLQM